MPCIRQAQEQGQQPFGLQAQVLVPQVLIAHGSIVGILLNAENGHRDHRLSSCWMTPVPDMGMF